MERKRIVVKIGSSSLTNAKGEIDQQKFMDHIKALAKLKQQGHDVLLVSSGAVAAGFRKLGYSSRPVTIKGKQAAAAVGQSLLIGRYTEEFSDYGITPAQQAGCHNTKHHSPSVLTHKNYLFHLTITLPAQNIFPKKQVKSPAVLNLC
mgnify:CR=1 FL=1